MENIASLIAEAKAGSRDSASAISRLKAMGALAAPAVVEEIRHSPLGQVRLFSEILEEQALDPAVLPILVPLLKDDTPAVKLASHQALRRIKDARSVQPLLDILLDDTQLEVTKGLAARTLGDVNDPRSINGLRTAAQSLIGGPQGLQGIPWAAKEEDEDKLRLAIEIAVALAKLGNHEMYPVVRSIILSHCSPKSIDESTICSEAVAALACIVGPEMLPTLRLAIATQDAEVRFQAVDPLRYLGTREAVEWLIEIAKDRNESVAGSAATAIHDITGQRSTKQEGLGRNSTREMQEWWSRYQRRLRSGVCYRSGKPISLSTLIELLADPAQKSRVLGELLVVTGNDFTHYSRQELEKWHAQNRAHFHSGRLYKFGYEQDIRMLT